MSSIEIIASICGILYVVLMTRRSLLCWHFGNLSVALIAYSCFRVHLYADMVLQFIYLVVGVVGFVRWKNGEKEEVGHNVRRLKASEIQLSALATLTVWGLTTWALWQIPTSRYALVDSALFAASILATWLQTYKYLENWMIWIPVNLAYAVLYWLGGLWAYSVLSILYAALSINGWRVWLRTTPQRSSR